MKNNFIKFNMIMLFTLGTATLSNAQITGGVSYLKGKWVEVAISDCGTYASGADGVIQAAPGTYHENMADGSLGMTNDITQDGWDVGIPDQCGDYIMPGSPEEGWAIQFGTGVVYGNISPFCYRYGLFVADAPDFPGTNTTSVNGGTIRKSVWQGSNTDLGLAINQTTYYLSKKQSYITIVDVCNGGDLIPEFYYARNADPDNDQINTGSFTTVNEVKKQYATDGYSQVTATSAVASPCYMGYVTGDARGKVSRGNFSMGEPSDIWNGTAGYVTGTGSNTADEAIQVSFKLDSLGNNDCACFTYSTIFKQSEVTNQVALTNTACATLGTLARFGEDAIADYLDDPNTFLNNQFVAYPNPSTGSFTVNMFEIENANITVVNVLGEVVYSAFGVNYVAGVNLEHVLPGLYIINVEHNDKVITKSIVIE